MNDIAKLEGLQASLRRVRWRLADEIGLAIMRGDYPPGLPLPAEQRLCGMLGVSRTAMREAVRGLIAKGLVESRPKIGTRVRERVHWNHLDPDVLRWRLEVWDTDTYLSKVLQLRLAAEPAAAALAARAADAGDHTRLRHQFDAMVAAGEAQEAWVEADLQFHQAIYVATHNEFFWPIGELFGLALKEMFRIAALGSHRARAIVEHRDLLNAVVEGKPELAHAAALTLVRNAASDVALLRGPGPASTGEAPRAGRRRGRRSPA